jgi:hypothetical protein
MQGMTGSALNLGILAEQMTLINHFLDIEKGLS